MSAPNNNNTGRPGNPPPIGNLTAAQAQAMQNHSIQRAHAASQAQQAQVQSPMMFTGMSALGQQGYNLREWNEFFVQKPEFVAIANDRTNQDAQNKLQLEFSNWRMQKARSLLQQQQQQQLSAAAAALARPALAQPTVTPAARLASTSAATASSLQQKAAEIQDQALQKLSSHFSFLTKPTSNEEKSFLPTNRLNALAKKAIGDLAVGKLTPDAAAGMKALASDFSKEAISYAIAAARRKRANKLDPTDVAIYLQHTWGIELPGFSLSKTGGGVVAPYKRLSASEVHKARLAAVRRGNVAQTRLAGAAGGVGASGGGGAGPSGTGSGGGGAPSQTGKGVTRRKITSKAAYAEAKARERGGSGGGGGRGGDSETEEDGAATVAETGDDEMEEDMPDIM